MFLTLCYQIQYYIDQLILKDKYILALRTTESDEATSWQLFVWPDPWLGR